MSGGGHVTHEGLASGQLFTPDSSFGLQHNEDYTTWNALPFPQDFAVLGWQDYPSLGNDHDPVYGEQPELAGQTAETNLAGFVGNSSSPGTVSPQVLLNRPELGESSIDEKKPGRQGSLDHVPLLYGPNALVEVRPATRLRRLAKIRKSIDRAERVTNRQAQTLYTKPDRRKKPGEESQGATANTQTNAPATTPSNTSRIAVEIIRPPGGVSSNYVSLPDDDSVLEASDASTTDDSSDDDYSEDTEEFPLASENPSDFIGETRYNVAKILWRPQGRQLDRSDITAAVTAFSEVVNKHKTRWDNIEKDETAKAQPPDFIKRRFEHERQLIGAWVSAANEFGHGVILNQLGAHPLFLLLLSKVLRDRIKVDDIASPIVADILLLMSRVNASASILDQLKFSKVGARLAKKGGPNLADLVEKINNNAATSINSKPQPKDSATDQSEARTSTSDVSRPPHIQASGVSSAQVASRVNKRPRENDGSKLQPAKKQATASTVPGLGTPANRPQGASGDNQRRIFAKRPLASMGTSTASKPKITHVVPKPSSFFKDLKSATKIKPQVPNTGQSSTVASKQNTPPAPAPTPAPTVPVPRPVSLFDKLNSLIAGGNAEKDNSASHQAPETEEEKRIRLRKESRRKLRVSFKPDESLEEIRYFSHTQEEEIGRDENLLLDAGDAIQEGRMFKQHKDMAYEDDEMDEMQDQNWAIGPYHPPPLIDFSEMVVDESASRYLKRAGDETPKSSAKVEQEQREATTLMAFFTNSSDIPPSPREPDESDNYDFTPVVMFGTPPSWVFDSDPRVIAERGQAEAQRQSGSTIKGPELSAVLNALSGSQPQQSSTPHNSSTATTSTAQQPNVTELEKIFAQFSKNTSQPAVPPVAPMAPVGVAPAPVPPPPMPDLHGLLAALAPNVNPAQGPPLAVAAQPQLQDVLTRLGQQNQAGNQDFGHQRQESRKSSYDGPEDGPKNRGPLYGEDEAYDRDRTGGYKADYGHSRDGHERDGRARHGHQRDNRDRDNRDGRDKGGNRRGGHGHGHGPEGRRKKPPCKYFLSGRCRKGQDCDFLH